MRRRARWPLTALCAATVAGLPLGAAAAQGHSRGATARPEPGAAETPPDVLQPATLPPLPVGMSLDQLVDGDRLFHGKGGCFACHGAEGEGLPAAGDGLSVALFYARPEWHSIDSLVTAGLSDALSRSPIAMPPRGARGDLSRDEIARVAAYVWAISQTRGEPWAGGHTSHASLVPPGSTRGTAQEKPWRTRGRTVGKQP